MKETRSGLNSRFGWVVMVVLLGGLVALGGCPRTDSCYISTPGLYCSFSVVEEDGQAFARAYFFVDSPLGTQVALGASCGDDITVNGIALPERRNVYVHYEAEIPEAETYEFEFTRDEKVVYVSTVTPPPPVTITAPVDETVVPRSSAFDITWEANNGEAPPEINLLIKGPCITNLVRDIADNGQYIINAGELEEDEEAETPDGQCDADIVLTRRVAGQMADGLVGGINGYSRDSVWFTSTAE